jgi:multicomponent K+:H+ antiporter subunit E
MKPFPILLTLALFAMWLLLNNSFAPGHVALAALLAFAIASASRGMRPLQPRMKRAHLIVGLISTVFLDIVRSNLAVARIVFGLTGSHTVTPGFMTMPLQLRDPHGLAALAIILTATPGTVWVDLTEDSSQLTLHLLDLRDEKIWIETIRQRYERPLMEIFG